MIDKAKLLRPVYIHCEPEKGAEVSACMQEAFLLAVTHQCTIQFIHNGRGYTAEYDVVKEAIRSQLEYIPK